MKKLLSLLFVCISLLTYSQCHIDYKLNNLTVLNIYVNPENKEQIIVQVNIFTKIESVNYVDKFIQCDYVILTFDADLSAKDINEQLPKKAQTWINNNYKD